jgi:SAM-dependent methyltransferase
LPAAARVLDLCCGSGDLSRELLARGYQVTGLDGSPEMLRYARQRVPRTEFLLEDARSFACEARFDAVLSTYDSLNHILSLEELEAVFANVFRALVPGGLFFFDLHQLRSNREDRPRRRDAVPAGGGRLAALRRRGAGEML